MLHILQDGQFSPATPTEATRLIPGLSILSMAVAALNPRGVRADGAAMDVRQRDTKSWDKLSDLQGRLFAGAEHQIKQARADAFTPGSSMFGSQDLIQNYGKVFDERLPPIVYPNLFEVENTIAIGAESYRIRMNSTTGEAQRYRIGSAVAPVSMGVTETSRSMLTFAAMYEIPYMIGQNGSFAGLDINTSLLGAGRTAISMAIDEILTKGTADAWGLGNYPGLSRYTVSVATLATITVEQLQDVYIGAMRRAAERSKTAFRPRILEVAPEVFTKGQTLTLDGTSMTVNQWFSAQTDGQGGQYEIRECWRLSSFGPNGEHAMFAHSSDASFVAEVLPPLVIPGPASQWSQTTYLIGQTGGLINPYPTGAEITLIAPG